MKSEYMILYTSVIPNSNRTSIILCDQRLKQKTKKVVAFPLQNLIPERLHDLSGLLRQEDLVLPLVAFLSFLWQRRSPCKPSRTCGWIWCTIHTKALPKSFASGSWRSGILHKMPLNSSIVMFIQVFERRLRARHSLTWWGPLKPWGFTEIGVPTCLMTFRFGMSKYLQLSLEYSYHDACSWWSLSLYFFKKTRLARAVIRVHRMKLEKPLKGFVAR